MQFHLVTPAASGPVNVVEARAHCRADVEDDPQLSMYLATAVSHLEGKLGVALGEQTWRGYARSWPAVMAIKPYPLVSITSIQYLDAAGDLQTLPADQYHVVNFDMPGRVDYAHGITLPELAAGRADAVRVEFVAGFGAAGGVTPLPADMISALLWLTSHQYEHRGDDPAPKSRTDPFEAVINMLYRYQQL